MATVTQTTTAPKPFEVKTTAEFSAVPTAAAALPAEQKASKEVNPMALLLQNQMHNFVQKMAADGVIKADGQEAALAQVAQMMASISIPAAPTRTRTKKEVSADCRCMARVWGGGAGTQCTFSRKPGCGDYCSRCYKNAQICEEPLQFTETGKHKGLFWGRIDQPKPIMSDGYVTVQWKDAECAEKVAKALAEGATFHPFSGEAKKKVKGPRKPRGAKKAKSKKPKARRAKNAFFWFLGEKRQEMKQKLIDQAEEGEKVGVADVTKALGAVWKTMDETARAPYVALEKEDKAKAQAELEASLATMNEPIAATAAEEKVVNQGLGNDEIGEILAQGLASGQDNAAPAESLDTMLETLGADETPQDGKVGQSNTTPEEGVEYVKSSLIPQDEGDAESDDDEEEVSEHTLADGSTYYLGSDGTLYDTDSHEIVGTHDAENNVLIPK